MIVITEQEANNRIDKRTKKYNRIISLLQLKVALLTAELNTINTNSYEHKDIYKFDHLKLFSESLKCDILIGLQNFYELHEKLKNGMFKYASKLLLKIIKYLENGNFEKAYLAVLEFHTYIQLELDIFSLESEIAAKKSFIAAWIERKKVL